MLAVEYKVRLRLEDKLVQGRDQLVLDYRDRLDFVLVELDL
jgi:hypothetical protein